MTLDPTSLFSALLGGLLIGIAVSLMLLLNGRVTGVSGILGSVLDPRRADRSWRFGFIVGMLAGGFILKLILPGAFLNSSSRSLGELALAGFLVGLGTTLGNGCTSGHGVCGVSRFSKRSMFATVVFILVGMMTVAIIRSFGGGLT